MSFPGDTSPQGIESTHRWLRRGPLLVFALALLACVLWVALDPEVDTSMIRAFLRNLLRAVF